MPDVFNLSDVFISYSRRDKPFVERLTQALEARGHDVWVDWQDIPPTADWWTEIQAGIDAANTFVFIISPDSVRSRICRDEIQHALNQRKRFVPVLHREVSHEEASNMHPAVGSHNWVFFRPQDDFNASLERLLHAITVDLDHVRQHTRLLVRAKEWRTRGHDESFLLLGTEVRESRDWLNNSDGKQPPPLPVHTEYIRASVRAYRRRRRNALIGAVFVTLITGLMMLSFVLFQLAQQSEARAQALALAARAEAALNGGQNDVAVLLGIEALEDQPYTSEAERVLGQAISRQLRQQVFTPVDLDLRPKYTVVSPDRTRRVELDGRGRTAIIYENINTGQGNDAGDELFQLRGHTRDITGTYWSPEGERLLTISADSSARVWDASTGALLSALFDHTDALIDAAWAPDGDRLVTASNDGTIRIWNMEQPNDLPLILQHDGNITTINFDESGTQLVAQTNVGSAYIWDLWQTVDELLAQARACCLVRGFTDAEARIYGFPLPDSAAPPVPIPNCQFDPDATPAPTSAFVLATATPGPQPTATPTAPPSVLYEGVRAMIPLDSAGVDVHRVADGDVIGQLQPGQTFLVDLGPECRGGSAWFLVYYGIGPQSGWVREAVVTDAGVTYLAEPVRLP